MDSFIEIELYDDKPYVAGQPVYGTVHLHCKDNINDVKCISITLKGDEEVSVNLPESKGGASPAMKIHPIVNERFVLFDYTQYDNVILQGCFSYPITVWLPEWLPQSHLCFNTPDAKKPNIVNSFKVKYELICAIEKFSEVGGIVMSDTK